MTKTEELLKLAEAATTNQGSFDKAYAAMNAFDAAANPTTIKQLVELVRLQHEALKLFGTHYECEDTFYSCPAHETAWEERKGECCCGADRAIIAIAAYERFEKGEG